MIKLKQNRSYHFSLDIVFWRLVQLTQQVIVCIGVSSGTHRLQVLYTLGMVGFSPNEIINNVWCMYVVILHFNRYVIDGEMFSIICYCNAFMIWLQFILKLIACMTLCQCISLWTFYRIVVIPLEYAKINVLNVKKIKIQHFSKWKVVMKNVLILTMY